MTGPAAAKPALYTVPAGVPFVDALAAGILTRAGPDPVALARTTVLLPTRRACRALSEAFLRLGGGRPMLLPALTPLGDVDEDELALSEGLEAPDGGFGVQIPPPMAGLRRQLLLARLILGRRDATPDQAARLAVELARFLDQVQTERLGFDGLAGLVPEDLADHWQRTLDFLAILTEHWPKVLVEEGCIDPAEHRNLLLAARAEAWRKRPPADPVIAAGSTGSIPATADLLEVVAHLPRGCVVLPGLDRGLDAESRDALPPSHPQYGMVRLLERLGGEADRVEDWSSPPADDGRAGRAALIGEALRPAATAAGWRSGFVPADDALEGVRRIDCPGPREEAGVIALIMRQTLETPAKTAALVTPDRALARRVAAELRRWGIEIDDSAGQPLGLTAPGAFLRLTARMAAEDFAPVPLLAALKHPLASGGQPTAAFRAIVRRLEIAVLRGPRPAAGIKGLRAALLGEDHKALAPLLERLAEATGPLVRVLKRKKASLRDLVRAHTGMAEALAATDSESGAGRLWAGDAGEAAAAFVAELGQAGTVLAGLHGAAYAALFDVVLSGRAVRPRYGRHPRLHIWGLLEARLQHADVMILGGLNEGTWPPEAHASPWMSRPMLKTFGLPLPERRIGLAAHDFCQAFSAPEVVLTRAQRVEGTPTVPSRWLLRLHNLIEGTGLEGVMAGGAPLGRWFAGLDAAKDFRPVGPPAPRPPVAARPRRLSVTRIETWVRDPYSIYARDILKLKPLDPIDADPGAAERGSIVHQALERFQRCHGETWPEDAFAALVAIGEAVFEDAYARPGVRAFWWPRFVRIARWFVAWEAARRAAGVVTIGSEAPGELVLAGAAGDFVLTARADRIDRLAEGRLAVLDYKTGQPPSEREVKSGLVPQLSLEAVMARLGAFDGIEAADVAELAYVRLSGGRVAGEERRLKADAGELADEARHRLERRIAQFDDAQMPYRSRPHVQFIGRFGAYDHLARVKEWPAEPGS